MTALHTNIRLDENTEHPVPDESTHLVSSVALLAAGAVAIALAAGVARMHQTQPAPAVARSTVEMPVAEPLRPRLKAGVQYLCNVDGKGSRPALACIPR
jgi:hypothetical protein